jgi:hypothetical protein
MSTRPRSKLPSHPSDEGREPESGVQATCDGDRPTALPMFDPVTFARDSESKLAIPEPRVDGGAIQATFARFGTMASVPWITVPFSEIQTLPLDPRSAFVLSLVDGIANVEMLLDICGMSRDEALRILIDLIALGAIELH